MVSLPAMLAVVLAAVDAAAEPPAAARAPADEPPVAAAIPVIVPPSALPSSVLATPGPALLRAGLQQAPAATVSTVIEPPARLPRSVTDPSGRALASEPPDKPSSKKDLARAEKSGPSDPLTRRRWHAQLDRRRGKPPIAVINIFNTWTHEWLPVDATGPTVPPAPVCAGFFRCHFTNAPANMDPRLLNTLVAAARHFKVRRVHIVSGFRSPKYNLMLRKKGREVARDSQHTRGHAVDFRLPGVPIAKLHAWARSRRLGGVGLYVASGFIHIDVGPIRYWNGK